ncbi:MAG: hypothetical protein MJZ29_02945 [Bacteroidaceae bacterium]|nr:hypothetical protein [Bacteroidaceae bacterium]
MANDDTLYRNVENEEVQEKNEKKSTVSDNLKMAGAAAAGAAVGSAASMGAQAAINNHAAETAEAETAEGAEEGEVEVAEVEVAEAEAPAQPQVVEHTVHHYHNTEVHHHHHHAATPQQAAAPQQPEEPIAQNNAPEEPQNIEDPNIQQTSGGEDVDIRVIGVEHDVNMNGQDVDVAVISVDGHQGLLVDVDQEGTADVAVIDIDDSGTISENEVQDISDYNVPMPEQTSGDDFMQASDDMPDYTNDAVMV